MVYYSRLFSGWKLLGGKRKKRERTEKEIRKKWSNSKKEWERNEKATYHNLE
jgi:hypothetical protein